MLPPVHNIYKIKNRLIAKNYLSKEDSSKLFVVYTVHRRGVTFHTLVISLYFSHATPWPISKDWNWSCQIFAAFCDQSVICTGIYFVLSLNKELGTRWRFLIMKSDTILHVYTQVNYILQAYEYIYVVSQRKKFTEVWSIWSELYLSDLNFLAISYF